MSKTLDALILPDGLAWDNRFDWVPVVQQVNVTITGGLVIQEALQTDGRPISLIGGSDHCWITKLELDALYAKASIAGLEMTLFLEADGSHQVVWNRSKSCIEAAPIVSNANPTDEQLYILNALHFLKVG